MDKMLTEIGSHSLFHEYLNRGWDCEPIPRQDRATLGI